MHSIDATLNRARHHQQRPGQISSSAPTSPSYKRTFEMGSNRHGQASAPSITLTSPRERSTAASMQWVDDGTNGIPTSISFSDSEVMLFGGGGGGDSSSSSPHNSGTNDSKTLVAGRDDDDDDDEEGEHLFFPGDDDDDDVSPTFDRVYPIAAPVAHLQGGGDVDRRSDDDDDDDDSIVGHDGWPHSYAGRRTSDAGAAAAAAAAATYAAAVAAIHGPGPGPEINNNPGRVSLAPSRSSQLRNWPLPMDTLPVPDEAHLAPPQQTNNNAAGGGSAHYHGDEGYERYAMSRTSSLSNNNGHADRQNNPVFASTEALPAMDGYVSPPPPPPATAWVRRVDGGGRRGRGGFVNNNNNNAPGGIGSRTTTPLRLSPFGNAIVPTKRRVYTIQGTARFWAVIAGLVVSLLSTLAAMSAMVAEEHDSGAIHIGCVAWVAASVVLACLFMGVLSFLVARREYQERVAAQYRDRRPVRETYWVEMGGLVAPGQQQ